MKLIDLTGRKFGRLTAISRAPNLGHHTQWNCVCVCGQRTVVGQNHLKAKRISSCGCLRNEMLSARSLTHGNTRGQKGDHSLHTPEYRAWSHAKARCNNRNDSKFPQYGGRGIRMCKTWEGDFSAFLKDMGSRPDGMTLERKDVDGDYSPDNCIWASLKRQSRNKQNTAWVVWRGVRMSLSDVADTVGLDYKKLHSLCRIKGLPIETAVLLASQP